MMIADQDQCADKILKNTKTMGSQGHITISDDEEDIKQFNSYREMLYNNQGDTDSMNKHHSDYWKTLEKILTIFFSFILCAVVLVAGVTSRVTLHILVWHLNPPTNISNVIQANVTSVTSPVGEAWIWSIFFVMVAPYVFTLIATGKNLCVKKTKELFHEKIETETTTEHQIKHVKSFLVVLLVESIHSIGLCCLVYIVLPTFNPPAASVVLLAVLFVLPLLDISNLGSKSESKSKFRLLFALCCLLLQIAGIGMIGFYIFKRKLTGHNITILSLFVVSVIFVSFKYWETFVDNKDNSKRSLQYVKWIYQTRRHRMAFAVHVWKTVLTFISVLVIFSIKSENYSYGIKSLFNFGSVKLKNVYGGHELGANDKCGNSVPFALTITNIVSSYICAKAAKTACMIKCQRLCFSLPLYVVPIASVIVLCVMYFYPIVQLGNCMDGIFEKIDNFETIWPLVVAVGALFFSLIFATSHTWMTNGYKLGETRRMFVEPLYCGINSDISLLLNRRRNDGEYDEIKEDYVVWLNSRSKTKNNGKKQEELNKKQEELNKKQEELNKNQDELNNESNETRKKIYACATMWHETDTEMTQLLISLLRMDKHKLFCRLTTSSGKKEDTDESYDFEAHLFFDDAFDAETQEANEYVESFVDAIDKAARVVHNKKIEKPYQKESTPYGGRLTWEMPKGNKLVAHLKDKTKIRHKKRWSQVMYMHYFLGYYQKKSQDLKNTYILALDGDVDFKPKAVMHLLQRMAKDPFVGAACGRIHPIGLGPLVWYQQFEYAVSHWLQKATEHVIGGCVLCSPGCFSLFRVSCLSFVLEEYSQISEEAKQIIQFDQGEDRWLCTLLLKKGNKILYCAESDAFTFAPEGFRDFFIQRRRWIPSTMANIIDILGNWREIVNKNQSFTTIYAMYQFFLFISSLLTPGTIFLMILGAIIVGFPSVPSWLALLLNAIPVAIFMLSCFVTKNETQLQIALFFSSVHALVMTIALVGILKEAIEEGFCSMTTIFLWFVAGVFIISALLHPREGSCLIHGILYFIMSPATQMLMLFYALGNLHVVVWGTRDNKSEAKKKKDKSPEKSQANNEDYTLYIGRILRCECCLKNRESLKNQSDEEKAEKQKEEKTPNKICIGMNDATQLDKAENTFWKLLIAECLYPIDNKNEEKKKTTKRNLMNLRNRYCLFFFLINASLVTVVYALTHSDVYHNTLSIYFSCHSKDVQIEPISVTFTLVFGILLFIQFCCLLFHRISTLIHITATTTLTGKINHDENFEKIKNILLKIDLHRIQISDTNDDNVEKGSKTEDITDETTDVNAVLLVKLTNIKRYIDSCGEGNENKMCEFVKCLLEQLDSVTERELLHNFITTGKYESLLKNINIRAENGKRQDDKQELEKGKETSSAIGTGMTDVSKSPPPTPLIPPPPLTPLIPPPPPPPPPSSTPPTAPQFDPPYIDKKKLLHRFVAAGNYKLLQEEDIPKKQKNEKRTSKNDKSLALNSNVDETST